MATSNTQVTAYLPEHILEYLTEYCTQYGIVRKKDSKPLLATGIVDLLNIVSTIPIEELTKFTPQTIKEDTLEKKLTDSKVVSKLLDTLLGDMALRQRLIDALTPVEIFKEDKTLLSTLPEKLPITEDEDNDNLPSNVVNTLPSNQDEEMTVRKDEQNIYEKNLGSAIDVSSQEVKEEIKPIDEDVEVILPKPDNNGKNELINEDVEDIKTLSQALDEVIIPMKKEGKMDAEIARKLEGKYFSSKTGKSTVWQGSLVKRAIEYREKDKA